MTSKPKLTHLLAYIDSLDLKPTELRQAMVKLYLRSEESRDQQLARMKNNIDAFKTGVTKLEVRFKSNVKEINDNIMDMDDYINNTLSHMGKV